MSNRFDTLLAVYRNPQTSEFKKGQALGAMNEIDNQSMRSLKEKNPQKYHEVKAKRAKARAEYHEKQQKKR